MCAYGAVPVLHSQRMFSYWALSVNIGNGGGGVGGGGVADAPNYSVISLVLV